MEEENSTVSHHSDAMTTTEETQITRGNTVTSWWSNSNKFYFTLAVVVIGVIGTLGNAIIVYALVASKQYKKYWLILNQNALDLYTCVFLVITFSVRHSDIHRTGAQGYWHCTLIMTDIFVRFGILGSVINLAMITVERYLKICTKKKLRRWMIYSAMAFAWIASVVYNVTSVFPTTVVVNGTCRPYAIFINKFAKSFYLVVSFLSFYIVILFIFIFCYGRILIVVRRQAKVLANHTAPQSSISQTQSNKIQTNVIKTMVLVSALYAVMWLPQYVVMLLYYFLFLNPNKVVMIVYYVTLLCQFLYMSINPFIYATTFDPVKQVIFRMIPWKRTAEQTTENVSNSVTCLTRFCN